MTADQPEAQPETAEGRDLLLNYRSHIWDSRQESKGIAKGILAIEAAARAEGFREGAAEGAGRYREALPLLRRIFDGATHFPSGLLTFGRHAHITAGVVGYAATDAEAKALFTLLADWPVPEARKPGIDVEPGS